MKLKLQENFWQDFLQYERLYNWAVAAGSIENGTPIISYGGNWAYTQQAFDQVDGFENIFQSLGGDDDLLLQKFSQQNLKIRFCTNPEGWVTTRAPESFQNFLQQRRRHIAAGKYYQFKFKIGYFIYHTSNLLLWIIWLFFLPALILLGLKIFINARLIILSGKIFKERLKKFRIVIYEFLFLLYSEFLGIIGLLGKIKW
jgi:cellulose synthase/poly-beta-1,6-N-acetylglucosamine synthase-like glycosyltransferase